MCIAALAWQAHPRWRLIALANRDEFHARPASPLARDGNLVCGRDLQSGGTWLGVRDGAEPRFVLVTNHRADGFPQAGRPSRGALVTALLDGADPGKHALGVYNPFNLFAVSNDSLWLLGNHPEQRRRLEPGLHGLSNGPFDDPWPKTRHLADSLSRWLANDCEETEPLFAALADETLPSPGDSGPKPYFSPVFIRNPHYGTRCSTLVLVDRAGNGRIIERRFDRDGKTTGETGLHFTWP